MKKTILIVGSSSEIADCFIDGYKDIYDIVTISRKPNKLRTPHLTINEYSTESISNSFKWFSNLNKNLDTIILMNGFGKSGKITEIPLTHIDNMVNANILVPYKFLYFYTQKFIEQGNGNVICFGSVAGIKYSPNYAMYSATKFAIRAIIEAYRNEFQMYNIKTTNLQPGFVETKFWDEFAAGDNPFEYDTEKVITAKDTADLIHSSISLNNQSKMSINEITFRSVYQER